MLLQIIKKSLPYLYKRNTHTLIITFNQFSTKYNNQKMEEVSKIEAKIQEIKIQSSEVKKEQVEIKQEQGEIKLEENSNQPKQKKQKKPKAEKPKVEKKEQNNEDKDEVGPKLFSQIDIRVSQIVQCWKHPASQNLYCEKIEVKGEVRQIASGLQKFVPLEKMTGKVIVMANLKPRPLAGFNSNGMVVCASNAEHTNVQLIIPEGQLGQRVYLQGFEELFAQEQIQPLLNPKKKVLERCIQFFKTDEQGFIVWKGIKLRTKAGYLKSQTINNGSVS